jgi:ADP-ribose pyrophosphatase YjhB (NUDIX family)
MRIVRVRALIEHENKLLLVQHPHHPEDTWALPGGRVDDGEQLEQAIARELVEELGVAPQIGRVRYIQQLFLANGDESLEFFFSIKNGEDYLNIDLSQTTHGQKEIREAAFVNPIEHTVLPEFIAEYARDRSVGEWPIIYVRHANGI